MSPRPWPENVMPTAEQWLDWLLTLDRDAQIEQAENVMHARETAHTCFVANHEGLLHELATVRQYAAAEYKRGVDDVCEAIRTGLEKESA